MSDLDTLLHKLKSCRPGSDQLSELLSEPARLLCAYLPQQMEVPRQRISAPGYVSLAIRDVGEKAYQRAFYIEANITLGLVRRGFTTVRWHDMEIPVNAPAGRLGQRRIDLIGSTPADPLKREIESPIMVVAELKDAGGDSPFYALFEAISCVRLARLSRAHGLRLPTHEGARDGGKYWGWFDECKRPMVIVAGPDTYWRDLRRAGSCWLDHRDSLSEVARWLDQEFDVIFACFNAEDFLRQRGNRQSYVPIAEVSHKESYAVWWRDIRLMK